MSSKRKSEVIKSLPFDCWCEIILFLSSTKDFHSVLLTVRGLQSYIQRLYTRCTENVVHFIRRIPPKQKSHVCFVRFSCNPSLFDFEEQKNVWKDFFSMEESNKKEIEVSDLKKDLKKHLIYSSFGVDDFETLFSKLLSRSLFPNLLRLEIEVIEKIYFKYDEIYCRKCDDYHRKIEEEGEFIDPQRNITIENTVLTTSRVQNLKHLRLSLTCRRLSIKQVLSTVESVHILRLGALWVKDDIMANVNREFDSFFIRYDLDVEWKEIFPRVKNLRLHCWRLKSSQFRPISSQLENLWLDHVGFRQKEQDRFRLSELKCKSIKLTGYSSTLLEDDGINDLENLVINTISLYMNYFTDLMFRHYSESFLRQYLSFSNLKNFFHLRVFELYNSDDNEFSILSGEIIFKDLPKLEIIRLEDIDCNINISNCTELEIFKFQFSEFFDFEKLFCTLIMNGDFPKLRKLSANNMFLDYSSILCFSQTDFSSLVSLYVGFEFDDGNLFKGKIEENPNNRIRENSSKERSVDLVISGFQNLQKLKIGHLCLDRSLTGITDCQMLEILVVRRYFSLLVLSDKSNLPNLKSVKLKRVCKVLVENLNNLETFYCKVCNSEKSNFDVSLRSCLNLKSAEFDFLFIYDNPNRISLQDLPKCKNLIIGPRRKGCDVFHIKNVGVKVLTVNDFLEMPKPRDTQISLQIREFPFSVSGEEFPGLEEINIFEMEIIDQSSKGHIFLVFEQLKDKKLNTIVLKETSKIVKLTSKMEGINLDTVKVVVVGDKMIISLSEYPEYYLRRLREADIV